MASRAPALILATATAIWAQPSLPWWVAIQKASRLEATFTQESESQVFGSLRRAGTLKVEKGGRIRLAYGDGKLLVADGRELIHYDPDARTAQKLDLRASVIEMPLLKVLMDPGGLSALYGERATASGDLLCLKPRKPGLPGLELSSRGGRLHSVRWQDSTGARQTLILDRLVLAPARFPEGTFTFKPPSGTRWLSDRLR